MPVSSAEMETRVLEVSSADSREHHWNMFKTERKCNTTHMTLSKVQLQLTEIVSMFVISFAAKYLLKEMRIKQINIQINRPFHNHHHIHNGHVG